MNLDLTDAEAEALIQELSGTINYARYPPRPSHSNTAGDPPEAPTGAGPRALFAAEGVCAAIEKADIDPPMTRGLVKSRITRENRRACSYLPRSMKLYSIIISIGRNTARYTIMSEMLPHATAK
jgi:hypothetical protein